MSVAGTEGLSTAWGCARAAVALQARRQVPFLPFLFWSYFFSSFILFSSILLFGGWQRPLRFSSFPFFCFSFLFSSFSLFFLSFFSLLWICVRG